MATLEDTQDEPCPHALEAPAGAAAGRDRRLRRRRQEHAHRSPAARHEVDPRGPARGRAAHERRAGRRTARPRAADRRPARRARAGHHDRRRLPLLRDRAALVHPRRHPGPRPLHAQHGHRRVDRGPRARAHRRAPGRARAVAPPRVHRVAPARPARRRRRQQDGPRRLRRGHVPAHRRRLPRASRAAWAPTTSTRSRSPRCSATTSSTARESWTGTTGRRCCATSRRSTSPPTAIEHAHVRLPVQYVVRPHDDAHHDYRGYAGRVAGGTLRVGDDVVVLPSGARSRVAGIDTFDGPLDEAGPAMSVTVRLSRRPRRLARPGHREPRGPAGGRARARRRRVLVRRPALRTGGRYLLKAATRSDPRDGRRAPARRSTSTRSSATTARPRWS